MLATGASIIGVASVPAIAFAAGEASLTPSEPIDNIPEHLPGAPMRASFLEAGSTGERIRLIGRALTTRGDPVAGARLDFWHTDSRGVYDMEGYAFRGAQRTDGAGRFRLDTVMPGRYGGPPHVHFLLAKRLAGRPQPLLLTGAIHLPSEEEFATAQPFQLTAEFLSPDALSRVGGVLLAPCDIILEAG
jgi:protocatechuate 3,4-dioxygenase beta subunit